jgi:hypothetical protein
MEREDRMNLLTRSSRKNTDSPQTADAPAVPSEGQLEDYFLERLRRLQGLRTQSGETLDGPQRRLLDHALYSTYWDCVRLGNKADAQRLLKMDGPS